ncbi:MAG: hypothetical protein MMC33_008063 [Icmadophila ericetorum]|nr:hypothetical protein [Icmadophila ericetorum]
MVLVEELPNSTSISAPGWAYVPDTGYDPSKAPILPSGARKRNARVSGAPAGDLSLKQSNAIAKRLAELDKDNHRDIFIPIPTKQKEAGARPKGKTAATRKILQSQKTFANYIADEEALAAQQPTPKLQPSSSTVQPSNDVSTILAYPLDTPERIDAFLLESAVPPKPSEALLSALVNALPLSYNAARPAPSPSGKPQRYFFKEKKKFPSVVPPMQVVVNVLAHIALAARTHPSHFSFETFIVAPKLSGTRVNIDVPIAPTVEVGLPKHFWLPDIPPQIESMAISVS